MNPRRFLVVVPPLAGHVNPTLAVGGELARQGHEVAWTGFPEVLTDLLPADRTWIPAGEGLPAGLVERVTARSAGLRGPAALKFLFDDFLRPLADAMIPGVADACAAFDPDVLLVDQQTWAGAVVAEREGRPWATSASTSAELVDPFDGLPKVRAWADQLLVDLQVAHGIPAAEADAERIRCSRHLVLAFTTPALVGTRLRAQAPVAFVGPAVTERPEAVEFPWDRLAADRPKVLVSLGTVNAGAGQAFFRAAVDALAERQVQGIVVAPPGVVDPVPDGAIVQARVPQLALLPHLDAVICHGGHNTVCEALGHGLPLAVAPIRDDQPVIAEQVVAAGAGVRLRFARPTAATLGDAVDRILGDPELRAGAARIAASFAAAGGAPAAAGHLLDLAGHRDPSASPVRGTVPAPA